MILRDILTQKKDTLEIASYFKEYSPYLFDLWNKHATWLEAHQDYDFDALLNIFQDTLNLDFQALKEASVMEKLRVTKQRASLVIALYDCIGAYHVTDITRMLSQIADLLIEKAFKFAIVTWIKKGKLPLSLQEIDVGSGLIVVAMGKLGAFELNFSSDIDICVFFDPHIPMKHHQDIDDYALYDGFIRVTKTVIKLLSLRTEHGYVYRVDLRLRPDPASTKIVVPIQAAEFYYERSGQNWERAAWI